MRTRLVNIWYSLNASYWFVPAFMSAMAAAGAYMTISIDKASEYGLLPGWFYFGGSEGAFLITSTIASSMITAVGVVFSITVVVLALASSQFGPRLLKSFMRDPGTKMVIGTFLSTFIYSMAVLRSIRSGADFFVPYISVTFCVGLAFLSLVVLIYFIHHISSMIQAGNIAYHVFRDLEMAISRFLVLNGGGKDREEPAVGLDNGAVIRSEANGYLQAIDLKGLLGLARNNDLVIVNRCKPGDFIMKGKPLATVHPADKTDETLSLALNRLFIIGAQPTLEQDVEYAIDQLVQIAVRALSPAVNDPITAMTCIDWLGAALTNVAGQKLSRQTLKEADGKIRVYLKPETFAGLVDASFNLIRQSSRENVAITIRLLETLAVLGEKARTEEERAVLLRHINMVRSATGTRMAVWDRKDIEERYQKALESIGAGEPPAFLRRG